MSTELNPISIQDTLENYNNTHTSASYMRSRIGKLAASTLLVIGSSAAAWCGEAIFYPDQAVAASCSGTHCDAQGSLELSGGDWLGGNGVDVYANTGSAAHDININNYYTKNDSTRIMTGEEWQCVELVNRLYMSEGWIGSTWKGNGNTLKDNLPSGLTFEANGSIKSIKPGDAITLDDGGYGHVGIINSYNSATGKVDIVNQNTAAVHSSATLSDKKLTMSGWTGYTVQGIIEPPVDQSPENSSSPTRPSNPPYVSWNFETLEGDKSAISPHDSNTGQTPASVEFNNQLYVFSYDKDDGDLRYAKTVPGWQFDVLDGEGGADSRENADVGQTPAAVVYNNTLQVFYYDKDGGNLRHAWSADGTNWHFESLDGAPNTQGGQDSLTGQTPVAVVHNGTLQVFYYNASGGDLRHAWADVNGWHFETLEGDQNSVSGYNSNVGLDPTVVSQNGTLQLFYYDSGQGNLRHAWANSNGWHFENLDGDAHAICGLDGNTGKNPSAVEYQNTLQVFYYDQSAGNLRHAWSDTNGWHCETLDGDPHSLLGYDSDVGAMPTAAVVGDSLQVFAQESQWGALRHYWNNNSGWHSENFDGIGGSPNGRVNHATGSDPTVTTFGGKAQLFYYDQTEGNLRHAIPN